MAERAGSNEPSGPGGKPGGGGAIRPVLLALVVLYAAALFLLRPASPFEWDEVLFMHAMRSYDVARHHPHPPGYPVFVGAARAIAPLAGDPLLALQLVSILAAAATLVLLAGLARRLGAPAGAAAAGSVLLAVTPGFAFAANVGLSDAAGVAAVVAAVLAAVVALERPSAVPLAGGLAALALGVRPQLLLALLPAGACLVWSCLRKRRLGALAAGLAVGAAVSAACWLPPILATGFHRYFDTARGLARWMAENESHYRLPGAPLGKVLSHWLVRPFGPPGLAAAFWALVGAGAWRWWWRGNRELVAMAGGCGGCYLVLSMWSMSYTTAVRYVLPALPFLALLAAGVAAAPRRLPRVAAWLACGAWCAGCVAWAQPVYRLRREPAPVWAALEWVRDSFRPDRTTVVVAGSMHPHADYLLTPAGFAIVTSEYVPACAAALRAGGDVVVVLERPAPGQPSVFSKRWESERLRSLSRERYDRAVVFRVPVGPAPCASASWRESPHGWALAGPGLIELQESEAPRRVRVRAGAEPLSVSSAGHAPFALAGGWEAVLPVYPGPAGAVAVSPTAKGGAAIVEDVEFLPFTGDLGGLAPAWVVPQVAHLAGREHSEWRSDLILWNPQPRSLTVRVRLLATDAAVQEVGIDLAAGQIRVVRDVLGGAASGLQAERGFLLLDGRADGCPPGACSFLAFSRTYNANTGSGGVRVGEGLPAVALEDGIGAGDVVHFTGVVNDGDSRTNLGVASLARGPARLVVEITGADGQRLGVEEIAVAPSGTTQVRLATRFSRGTLRVAAGSAPGPGRLFPYASVIDGATGMPTHRLPDELARRSVRLGERRREE